MAIKYFTIIDEGTFKNKMCKAAIDKATWDGLTTLECLKGSEIRVLDFGGAGIHKSFIKKDDIDHTIATGFEEEASGGSFTQSSQAQAEAAASNTDPTTPTTLETDTGITPNRLWYFFQKAKEYILEAFGVLTFGSTVTWSANKSFNQAKVTATGDFILTITDLKSGSQGYLKIITNTASAITITFTSTTYTFKQLNVVKTTHTLPAGTAKEYFINFQVDGTDVELYINDRDEPLLSGDIVSDNNGVTTLQDEVVEFQHIDPAESRDLVVSNSTVQTALNTESGWSGDTKTGISDLLAGQIYEGDNLTSGVKYRYACIADGIATRVPVGQAQDITTLTTILQPLYQNYVDAGNVTTGETDLYTYTLPASGKGNLSNNGQQIDAYFCGIIVGHATATRRIRAYFGGTVIYDSTAVVYTANTDWYLKIDIVRVSASVVRAIITYRNSTTSVLNTKYTEVTGLTLSNTQVFKITGQAASTGAATNDIVAKGASIKYLPQSV